MCLVLPLKMNRIRPRAVRTHSMMQPALKLPVMVRLRDMIKMPRLPKSFIPGPQKLQMASKCFATGDGVGGKQVIDCTSDKADKTEADAHSHPCA